VPQWSIHSFSPQGAVVFRFLLHESPMLLMLRHSHFLLSSHYYEMNICFRPKFYQNKKFLKELSLLMKKLWNSSDSLLQCVVRCVGVNSQVHVLNKRMRAAYESSVVTQEKNIWSGMTNGTYHCNYRWRLTVEISVTGIWIHRSAFYMICAIYSL
jgi:hypothetical protein